MNFLGNIRKMNVEFGNPINNKLPIGDNLVNMNELIGTELKITFDGTINCVKCGKKTKKSFGEGFCYPCFASVPEAAECIIRPELCRGHLGEGRDVAWEQRNHVQPHIVYLALSSAVKVGITRSTQIPNRWIDQGASSAIILVT